MSSVSPTEAHRIRVTATSLLRQLEQEQPPSAAPAEHLATLKRRATAKHVKQLLTSLEGSASSASLAELHLRLAKAEASLTSVTPPPSQPPTPSRPTYIPTLSQRQASSSSSDPNSPNYDPYAPPVAAPGPLDFLLPEKPSLPLSLSRPGSRAGSPAPSHSNLLRGVGGAAGAGAGGYERRSYSPSPSQSYIPLSTRSLALPQHGDRAPSPALSNHSAAAADPYAPPPGRGSEASLSPTRARATHQPRERRKSTAGGPDDDYEPDAYSPVRERREASLDLGRESKRELEEEESGYGARENSMIDHGSSYGEFDRDGDDGDVDPEAGFGGKPDFPGQEEEEEDPEAGIGMADDDELDPEAGGMAFLPSQRRPHSSSVASSSTSARSKRPLSPSNSSNSALHLPPPPPSSGRRGSLSPTVSVTPPPSSGIRSRRAGAARPSALRSRTAEEDREDLLSGSGAPITSSDLLSHQHDLQNSLLSDLTSLSSQLKTNSQAFSSNLEKDRAVLEGAKEKLEGNHEKMLKEGARLRVGKKRQRGTMCWTIGVVGAVAVAWVVMFLLIKVT